MTLTRLEEKLSSTPASVRIRMMADADALRPGAAAVGDAGQLYDSIQRVLRLPDDLRLFVCHDYGHGTSRADFIKMREARDARLSMPSLIIASFQVNMRAGEVPRDGKGNMKL